MTETKKVTKKPTVGQKLKSARLENKLTLDQVSKQLCITKTTLNRIESETETLSCDDVYLIGFIRSYAVFLNLDANELVEEFKEGGQSTAQGNKNLNFPAPMPQESVPKTRILLGSAALAIILGFAVHQYTKPDSDAPIVAQSQPEAVAEIIPVPEEEVISIEPVVVGEETKDPSEDSATTLTMKEETQAVEAAPKLTAETSTTPTGPLSEKQVLMKVSEDSWIEVRNLMGDVVISKVFHPGDSQVFTVHDDLILHTGNAGGITLTVGEYTTPPLGDSGQVINNLSLQSEKLLAQYPKNQ